MIYLSLNSTLLPLYTIDEYGQTIMAQRISMISGVAQVLVYGSQKYAVRLQLNPQALASRAIGIDEVSGAVQQGNVNLPTGTLYGRYQAHTLQASGQLTNAEAYRPLIVAYRNGSPVRLQEIGKAIDSVENNKIASWYKDRRAIVLAIQRQPGTNTIEVVDSIKKLLPTFRAQLPASVNLDILYDRSESIRDSVNDVKLTLILTIFLVVLVIFFFLRNFSATLIPSLALPMSIIGTFAVMSLLNYSLDNLSLMALILSVGFVVDDAIVMLENNCSPHGTGRAPLSSRLERIQGNQFYHSFHDPFAGHGFRPGAFHGRDSGSFAQRVRRGHRRGHPGFRVCLVEPDPHALQPVFGSPQPGEAAADVPGFGAILQRDVTRL